MPESWRRVNEEFENPEIRAMFEIFKLLNRQSPDARTRMMAWVCSRLRSEGLIF